MLKEQSKEVRELRECVFKPTTKLSVETRPRLYDERKDPHAAATDPAFGATTLRAYVNEEKATRCTFQPRLVSKKPAETDAAREEVHERLFKQRHDKHAKIEAKKREKEDEEQRALESARRGFLKQKERQAKELARQARGLVPTHSTRQARWYPGQILEAHPDGTYDVRYDDGRYVDEEQRVERRYIRKRGERASEAERDIDEAGGGGGADALRAAESYGEQRLPHMPGDRVEVRLACAHVGAPQGPAHSDSHVARIREAKEKREEVERSLNVAK